MAKNKVDKAIKSVGEELEHAAGQNVVKFIMQRAEDCDLFGHFISKPTDKQFASTMCFQADPSLASRLLRYLEEGVFNEMGASEQLRAYDDNVVSTAKASRASDAFVKYCLCHLDNRFDLTHG